MSCPLRGHLKTTFICGVIVGCMLMYMRKSLPFLLVSLLLVQSVMSVSVQNASAAMGVRTTDDFSVTEITVNSTSASHWIQPDGTAVFYVSKGDVVDISVEVKNGGVSLQGSNSTVTVEMVHGSVSL